MMKNTDDFMRIEGHPEPLEIQENYDAPAAATQPAAKASSPKHTKPDRVGDFAWAGLAAVCVLALVGVVYFLSGTPERQKADGQPLAYASAGQFIKSTINEVGNDLAATTGATDAAMGDISDATAPATEPDAVYLFPVDGSAISENEQLNAVAQKAKDSDAYIAVTAYTDESGRADYNQQLSQRRAQKVGEYLIAHGVPANHVVVKGMGETHAYPTPQLDRRAEVRLM